MFNFMYVGQPIILHSVASYGICWTRVLDTLSLYNSLQKTTLILAYTQFTYQ